MALQPDRLRTRRKARGLTQKQVAARIESYGTTCDYMTVSRWERGVTLPGGDRLILLARALDVSVEYLTGEPLPVGDIAEPPYEAWHDWLSGEAAKDESRRVSKAVVRTLASIRFDPEIPPSSHLYEQLASGLSLAWHAAQTRPKAAGSR